MNLLYYKITEQRWIEPDLAVYNKEPSYNQNWVYLFVQQAKSKESGVRIRDTQLKIVVRKGTPHIFGVPITVPLFLKKNSHDGNIFAVAKSPPQPVCYKMNQYHN